MKGDRDKDKIRMRIRVELRGRKNREGNIITHQKSNAPAGTRRRRRTRRRAIRTNNRVARERERDGRREFRFLEGNKVKRRRR